MFGKLYESTFTGSMVGAGPLVFAVWGYAIAHCKNDDCVELNPALIAAVIGADQGEVAAVIESFCGPDPRSRSKREDGRRLLRQGEFQYFMVNHFDYRSIRNEDERREYNRLKQREHRARQASAHVKPLSQTCQPRSAHADADTDKDSRSPEAGARLYPDEFLKFYEAYPRKKHKGEALKAWKTIAKPKPSPGQLEAAVRAACASPDWRKDGGAFIPYPATWLRARGWEDELEAGAGGVGNRATVSAEDLEALRLAGEDAPGVTP